MEKARRSAAPFYAVAVLWPVYAMIFPLYGFSHYALLAVLSAALFLAVDALGGGRAKEPKVQEKPAPAKEEKDPALAKMLRDGELAIGERKRLDENIADPGISADIVRLEQVSQAIFAEVERDPRKLPQIRRFMDYYLPTTLKLLNAYDRMSAAGVSGENIDGTLAKVEGMMRTVVAAFEKQLDALYGTDALDISTDIQVLETMMAQEGLKEQELKADAVPPEGADIQLEL